MPKSHAHAREFREVLKLFALFGHPVRVVIFQRLARQPTTASMLAQQLPVSRVSVVQHVKRMERAGLLVGLRDGKRRVYRVQPNGLEPLERWLSIHRQAADLKMKLVKPHLSAKQANSRTYGSRIR
jgi:DNA-binding transcriptional ArsR family regulator